MAVKKEAVTYLSLLNDIKNKKFQPIYVLQGEEAYYIDSLTEAIIDSALEEEERDFNLTVTYGIDADVKELMGACRRYPMMAERQVIVLKEAQNLKNNAECNIDLFKFYAENPLRSTVLVICNKGGNLKSKEFLSTLKSEGTGVVFESKKETESSMLNLISGYVKSKSCTIDVKSATMLRDFVGLDVARMFGEIDKLSILVDQSKQITPEMIEKNIGISKDYNMFEFEDALIDRNVGKAFKILDYFEKNQKNNPVQLITPRIFGFFVNTLLVQTAKDKSQKGLLERLDSKSTYRLNKFITAAGNYSKIACVNNISAVRRLDAQSKGIGSRQDAFALLRDLLFRIMTS